MLIRARACALPKAGNSPDEYEDAVWPRNLERSARTFRAAIADGATETSFSGLWAKALVRAYTRGALNAGNWEASLAGPRAAWSVAVQGGSLSWYAEEKLQVGAFSSLAGLTLVARGDGYRWRALAVGDSCIFLVRAGTLHAAFPLQHSAEFDSRPALIGTRTEAAAPVVPLRAGGEVLAGDRFFLLTDAIASWFLQTYESGLAPWEVLAGVMEAGFDGWIEGLRAERAMRNDDVTVLLVDIG